VSLQARQSDVDIGLRSSRLAERDIEVVYQQAAPVMALMRPDHELARAPALRQSGLMRYPLALPTF
jgi:hypothetical protein